MNEPGEPFDVANHSHRRRNPLTGEWVLVSPHRNKRPWQGQTETTPARNSLTYDPQCYLCPGNQRMGGAQNPDYRGTFAFENDFPALSTEPPPHATQDPLFSSHAEQGTCRVLSYSPEHNKTLAELSPVEIQALIEQWAHQSAELAEQFEWVQIFENKGEIMGCSMPHPHGQIWAQAHAPTLAAQEQTAQIDYQQKHGQPLLLDYATRELADGSRTVLANADWLAVVPYWAAWPFETLVLPLFGVQRMTELKTAQQASLSELLSELLIRYDNLFECSFPYSMGWHGAPFNGKPEQHTQLHAHFYPPLLRSSSVRKFMVGYEMLAEPQRDLTPEQAADILRGVPATHYKFSTGAPQ